MTYFGLALMGNESDVLEKLGLPARCSTEQAAVSFVAVMNAGLPGALESFCAGYLGLEAALKGDGSLCHITSPNIPSTNAAP
jgi:hypothetical protein